MLRRSSWTLIALSACVVVAPARSEGVHVVRVGIAEPLTGFSASYGKDEENGARLAFEEANQQGLVIGGQKVRFEVDAQDDAADPRTSVVVAQRFVDEGVSGVIGHHNSGCSVAASALYARAGIPEISPTSSSPTYTAQGFNTTFRTISNDEQMAALSASYSVYRLGAKRIAVIDDGTDYGSNFVNQYVAAVQRDGGEIVSRQYTTAQSVDFRAILTVIKGINPDLIFFAGQDVQAAGLARQMRQLGIKIRFMGEGGFTNESFLTLAGEGAQGMYSWEYGLPLERMPRAAELDSKMKARFGAGIVHYAPLAYDASWAMINAMKQADSTDPKQYLNALHTGSFEGVSGRIAFAANGDLRNATATVYQARDGKWVLLGVEQLGGKESGASSSLKTAP